MPTGASSGSKRPRPVLVDLSQVQAGPREWVWRNRIPRKAASACDGDPGVGKTGMLLDLTKTVCEGGRFPDGEQAEPGRVLYVEGESGPEEIKRRLEGMGFTAWNNLRVLSHVRDENGDLLPLALEQHREALREAIKDFRPDWVIIDPLVAFHTRNEIKATEVRRLVNILAELAREYNAAVTFVQHLNKAWQAPAIYRTRGSVDFVAAARILLRVSLAERPVTAGMGPWALEVRELRILEVVKTNVGPTPPPLAFDIEEDRVTWYGQATLPTASPPARQTRLQEAIRFLAEQLSQGPKAATEVEKAATEAGHSPATIRRARKELGMASTKKGQGPWIWSLPGQVVQPQSDDHLDQLEHLPAMAVEQDDQGVQDAQDVQQDQTSTRVLVPEADPWDEGEDAP